MTPADFLAIISTSPSSFADIAGRLEAAHTAGAALWTPASVCDVVNECFGDFNHANLTANQLTRAGSLMNAMLTYYPIHNVGRLNPGQTRLSILTSYLGGEYHEVAGLRLPEPSQTTWPRRPVTSSPPPSPHATAHYTAPPTLAPDTSSHITPTPQGTYPPLPPPPLYSQDTRNHISTTGQTNARSVEQYHTKDRQYGGHDTVSLARARSAFYLVCDAFNVPPRARGACAFFALQHSDDNLPELSSDNRGATAEILWDLIDKRVNTTARTIRIRAGCQAATLESEPALPGDTSVTRFERLMSRPSRLQTQMPARYQTPDMLTDKLLRAIKDEWFEATVITDATAPPQILAARIKLMLATGPPRTPTSSTNTPAKATMTATAMPTYETTPSAPDYTKESSQ